MRMLYDGWPSEDVEEVARREIVSNIWENEGGVI